MGHQEKKVVSRTKQSGLDEIFDKTKDRVRKVWYMQANDEEER